MKEGNVVLTGWKRWAIIVLMVGWVILGTKNAWVCFSNPSSRVAQIMMGYKITGYAYASDVDVPLIMEGVSEKKTFVQTFQWWKEVWCGKVPFFRPLTSQLFWLENQAFGQQFQWWLAVALISHFVAMFLTFLAIEKLFGSTLFAGLNIALFAGPPIVIPFVNMAGQGLCLGELWRFGFRHFNETIPYWKNSLEYWVSISVFLGFLFFLKGKYWSTLLCALLAMATKEISFGFIPAIALVAWYKKQSPPKWFWWSGIGMTIFLLLYRQAILGGIGYRFGTNYFWWYKAISYHGGIVINQLLMHNFSAVIAGVTTGLFALCLVLCKGKQNKSFIAIGAIGLLAGWWWAVSCYSKQEGLSFDVAKAILVMNPFFGNGMIIAIAVTIVLTFFAVRYYPREYLFFFLCSASFSLGLYVAAQVNLHAWYVADIFRTTLFWWAIWGIREHCLRMRTKAT